MGKLDIKKIREMHKEMQKELRYFNDDDEKLKKLIVDTVEFLNMLYLTQLGILENQLKNEQE